MKARTKKACHSDSVLSPEELKKAIEEYKARRAAKTDADEPDEDTQPVVPEEKQDDDDTVIAPSGEDKKDPIAEKVAEMKKDACKKDSDGEEDQSKTIAQMDEDMQVLFDIIDTLLAERDFGKADEDDVKNPLDEENQDEDDDPIPSQECDEDDAPEEENEDEDDTEEKVPGNEDEDDEELENEDEDDDPIPSTGDKTMNADSVDAIVRQRIQLGMVGRELNMDGLENKSIMAAKKAVIRAVRPNVRLDGKSVAYINAAYDCAVEAVKANSRKDTKYQKRQMFNKDSRTTVRKDTTSAAARRQAMIDRQNKKEDK